MGEGPPWLSPRSPSPKWRDQIAPCPRASGGWLWKRGWRSQYSTPLFFSGSCVFRVKCVCNTWVSPSEKLILALEEGTGRNGLRTGGGQ